MNLELFGKYFKNELSEEEKKSFLKDLDKTELDKMEKIWEFSGNAFNNIKPDKDKMWNAIDSEISKKERKLKILRPLIRIAASILIVLTLGSAFYYFGIKDIMNKKIVVALSSDDEKTNITLTDGSNVVLNKASTLEYPAKFKGKSRDVFLKGEAYFEVQRNEKKPFIIHLSKTTIEVLGTSFNIRAFSNEDEVLVSVVTGKVKFSVDEDPQKSVILGMGQSGIFNNSIDTLYKKQEYSMNELAWKTGRLTFCETGLSEVCTILSKHFFQKISIGDPSIENVPFTATFENQKLEEVLTVLHYALNIKYEYKENEIVLIANE